MKFVENLHHPIFWQKNFTHKKRVNCDFSGPRGPLVLPSSIDLFVRPYQFFSFSFFSSSSPITRSPVQPDLLKLSQLIHLSHLIHPIHPIRLIHPNRFEKLQVRENALLSALGKFTQFILDDRPGTGIQFAWKNAEFVAIFYFLASFLQKLPPFAAID